MSTEEQRPGRWGRAEQEHPLPPAARRWLERRIGRATAPASAPARAPEVPPGALGEPARAALAAAVGEAYVRCDPAARLGRAAGRSYTDLLGHRGGRVAPPDAVVLPGSAEQVAAVLAVCAAHRLTAVPVGGATSVVGGVAPLRGDGAAAVLALDLARLDRLLGVDPVSRTARFEAGVRGPAAERLLAAHGFTLGHFPQSFEYSTVGGWAAARSSGQASAGVGRFDELVTALTAVTPAGVLRLGHGAASAAGPDLRALLLGSEGAFGVITDVTVRVRPLPSVRDYRGYALPGLEAGLAAVRSLAQSPGPPPHVVRLSDPEETRSTLALATGAPARALAGYLRARAGADACLLVLGFEGSRAEVRRARRAARDALRAGRAVPLGAAPGRAWERARFAGPYLREALLDHGVLVETLETSTTWSGLPALRTAVRGALRGALTDTPPLVLSHVSHVYPHGASLYVTVLARQDDRPAEQWARAKRAASEAILAAPDATITHHHGVGTEHRPYLEREIGELGVAMLRAVKAVLDPAGVCNPGKLIP